MFSKPIVPHETIFDETGDPDALLRHATEDRRLWRMGLYTPVALVPVAIRLIEAGYPAGLARRIAGQTLDPPLLTDECRALANTNRKQGNP